MSEKADKIIKTISMTLMVLCILAMLFISVKFLITSIHRQLVLREKLENYRETDKKLQKQKKDLDESK